MRRGARSELSDGAGFSYVESRDSEQTFPCIKNSALNRNLRQMFFIIFFITFQTLFNELFCL